MPGIIERSNNFYNCVCDAAAKSAHFYKDLKDDDIKYLEAVQRGDRATIDELIHVYAMKAFPDTVVKHKVWRRDGKPDIWVYEANRKKKSDAGWLGQGIYFYGVEEECDRAYGYGWCKAAFFINVKRPFDMPREFHDYIAHKNDAKVSERMTEVAKSNDYDGILWTGDSREEWCVLAPEQMKRADVTKDDEGRVIPITLRFDPKNPDNRY